MRGILVAICALGMAGCVESSVEQCENGTVCPTDSLCSTTGECAPRDMVIACRGLTDAAPCQVEGRPPGTCQYGVCEAADCGDSWVVLPEDCDGADLDGASCIDVGFYGGDLACNPSTCRFDTAGCIGTCGDNLVNGPEACDGTSVSLGCPYFGRDLGATGCTAGCETDISGCEDIGWDIDYSIDFDVRSIWSSGRDDAWIAVDARGLLHFDGVTWHAVPEIVDAAELVWGTAADDVYVMTRDMAYVRTLQHYDGAGWTQLPGLDQVRTLWKSPAGELYATATGTLYHLDPAGWSAVAGAPGGATDVTGLADGTLYVLTGSSIHRFDGAWTDLAIAAGMLETIEACGDRVIGVGSQATVITVTGTTATTVTVDPPNSSQRRFDDVSCTGPDDILVVGAGNNLRGVAYWNDGHMWYQLDLESDPFSPYFPGYMVTGTMRGRAIIVGSFYPSVVHTATASWATPVVGLGGPLWAGDGTLWSTDIATNRSVLRDLAVQRTLPDTVSAITGVGGHMFVFSYDRTVDHFDGSSWTRTTLPGTFAPSGAWGATPDDVWVVGSGAGVPPPTAMWHWDGASWSTVTPPVALGGLYAVWGSGPNDVFATGTLGLIIHYDGSAWHQMTVPPTYDLDSVWGTGPDNVLAVGASGYMVRYDGTAWQSVESGTAVRLGGVHGTSPDDVFVGGGGVMRWDGHTWTTLAFELQEYFNFTWVEPGLIRSSGTNGSHGRAIIR